ncbi:hypothetical protein RQP46_010760 [Phenoliferia psychrophenolica]
MASLHSLPTELLAHILHLSNEGEGAEEQQRARFLFGLIARAFFLATANTTVFFIAGAVQAEALFAQLEVEKQWAAQEEHRARSSGRTLRSATLSITRICNIRHLILTVDGLTDQQGYCELLRATPNLVALELAVTGFSLPNISPRLEVALGELAYLEQFHLRSDFLQCAVLARILIPLKTLRVVGIQVDKFYDSGGSSEYDIAQLVLPSLHTLEIYLKRKMHTFPNTLLHTLATMSTAGIQVLDLRSTAMHHNLSQTLLPHVANLVHLTCAPPEGPIDPLKDADRDAVLALIGAMKNLEPIKVPMWTTVEGNHDLALCNRPIDRSLLDTLAKLPSLHSVTLFVKQGELSKGHIISYVSSHESLQSLFIDFLREAWTWEQREAVMAVRKAAEQAGVAFSYLPKMM